MAIEQLHGKPPLTVRADAAHLLRSAGAVDVELPVFGLRAAADVRERRRRGNATPGPIDHASAQQAAAERPGRVRLPILGRGFCSAREHQCARRDDDERRALHGLKHTAEVI
jgi:hypothetical protein